MEIGVPSIHERGSHTANTTARRTNCVQERAYRRFRVCFLGLGRVPAHASKATAAAGSSQIADHHVASFSQMLRTGF